MCSAPRHPPSQPTSSDNGVANVSDTQFSSSWRSIYPSQPGLETLDWWLVAGNHDWRGNLTAQRAFSEADPRWHMPNLSYVKQWPLRGAKSARACLAAVFIDTTPLLTWYRDGGENEGSMAANLAAAKLPNATFAWVNASLASASAACDAVVCVGHHPIYTGGEHGDSPELITSLLPLLVLHGVDAYFCGHDHLLWAGEARGVELVLSGAGSSIRKYGGIRPPHELWRHEGNGFTAHTCNSTHFVHRYLDDEGNEIFKRTKPLRRKHAVKPPEAAQS